MKRTTADKWFSTFIRLRDATHSGYISCITCGTPHHWKEIDCGHFVTREKPMTRFDERNAHGQCQACNRFKKGEQAKHGFAIDKLYGEGIAELLIHLGGIRGQKIHTKLALKSIATEYRLKAKELSKQRGLTI